MGWSGKGIGGVLGRGIAHLLGAGEGGEEEYPVAVDALTWTRGMGPSGPGMCLTIEVSPARRVRDGAQALVWLQYDEDCYVEAALDDYADSDGDLCVAGELGERDGDASRAQLYLPWAALPSIKGDCLCQVSVVDGEEVLGNQWFELTLPNRATREVHSAMGALAYAAAAMIQPARELSESEAYAATRLMTGYFELDEVGQEVASRLFARAERKRPGFEKAARLVRDEIEPDNYSLVIDFLGEVARAAGAFTSRDQAFIQRLADAIGAGPTRGGAPSSTSEDVVVRSFRTLELEPGARLDEVRAAYRRLALDYHPDKVETLAAGFREYATARMQAINEAYQVLKAHLAGK